MENKEYNTYLKKIEEALSKKNKNDKNYLEGCKTNKNLNPKDYKIQTNHKLDEYFAMYGKKLESGKLLAYKKDELWLMNKKTTYWEIKNESDLVYFETQKNLKPLWISLAAVLAAGVIAGGITAGVILSRVVEYKGLKLTALEAGSKVGYIVKTVGIGQFSDDVHIQYSTDIRGENWTDWNGESLTLENINDFIFVRNTADILSHYLYDSNDIAYLTFTMSGKIAASGNVNSMINFSEISEEGCYCYLFQNCTSLTSAPEFPATTLTKYCYDMVFGGCELLTTAPELPATTLAEYCYNNMFYKCSSLTSAPELPATKLATGCYNRMFEQCMYLTQVPELPATELVTNCYKEMFTLCYSLQIGETNDPNVANKIFTCNNSSVCEDMFEDTLGSFTGTPNSGKTYYWYED